jgi:ADP-ribose pyrophosphatase
VDTVERTDGSRHDRDIAGHPGAVAIVAIDDADRIVLVRQWRTATGGALWEIPAGGLDVVDEATGAVEDPADAAPRELEEETGFRARTWRRLASFWSAPGFTSELMHVYLATGVSPAGADDRRGPEEDEHLRIEWRPFAEAVAAVERGEIRDAKSVAGILWVAYERARTIAASTAAE